ncbi:MAG TPA: phospholipid carrier-dependent glycosyltransferase [Candidatus Woesebacteria bacterium]|nr:phospholipid carrier-dependent glycosyltransferase [Candidatus Woesebacteria bacterium]
MNKEKLLLIIIIIAAFFIRIYKYNYPPLLWDEAALGYNAYSILKTGRDEYGQFLPLIFKSFGDYKPGLYIYLSIPFVAIFGLNPLSVRLPSIILGSLLPLIAYLFTKKYSSNKLLPLLFATIIAFNPYNIHFSRGAWETNILTFELLLASYLFFNKKYFWSSLTFGLTLFTYQSGKLTSLLLIFVLLLINYSKKYFQKDFILKFIFPLFIFSLPILSGLLWGQQGNRLEVVSLFSYPRSNEEQNLILSEGSQLDYQLFHNQTIFFTRNFLSRYLNHFSPEFLLTQGDWQSPRHSAPYIGVLLIPSFFFLILGLLSSHYSSKNYLSINLFFLLWLFLAPIPAALTRDSLSAVRIMSFSIPLCYFEALGIIYILNYFRKNKFIYSSIKLFIFLSYLFSFIYYGDLYLNHMVKKSPQDWLYGYREAVNYVIKNGKNRSIYFTNFYGQAYIYYLFYSQYPPRNYQSQANLTLSGVDTGVVSKIDNINFETPNFSNLQLQSKPILAIFSYDDAIRQGIDLNLLTPLSPINNISTFYGYKNP